MAFWKSMDSAPEDGSWFLVRGNEIRVPAHARMVGNKVMIHTLQEVHGDVDTKRTEPDGLTWHPLPPAWNTQ